MNNLNTRQPEQQSWPNTDLTEPDVYTFKREAGVWYVHLPVYLEQGWSKQDLQMTEGAHRFLNRISAGAQKVRLRLSTVPSIGSDLLQVVEHCTAPKGGAIYILVPNKDEAQHALFWICDLALFVFGDMPDTIYVQRLSAKEKPDLKGKDQRVLNEGK